jgi:hypothetical protein
MSYVPFRDNPDLAGISEHARADLEVLAEQIDRSSVIGNHRYACGCADPKCVILECSLACDTAETSEAVGWLFAKGWLAAPIELVAAKPEPDHDQLRAEIEQAAGPWILTCGVTLDQKNATAAGIARAVMPVVDELLTRARCMWAAAEAMAANVQTLTAELATKEAERARLRKLYSDSVREINILNDSIIELADEAEDEASGE